MKRINYLEEACLVSDKLVLKKYDFLRVSWSVFGRARTRPKI